MSTFSSHSESFRANRKSRLPAKSHRHSEKRFATNQPVGGQSEACQHVARISLPLISAIALCRFAGVARLRSSPAVKGRPARIVRRQTSVSDDAGVRFTDHRMSARRVVMFYRAMFGCGRSGASSTENDRGGKQNSCLGQHLRMSMMPAVPGCQMGTETSNAKSNWPA